MCLLRSPVPILFQRGLHGKLVMCKGKIAFRVSVIRILRADVFECRQAHRLLFQEARISGCSVLRWHFLLRRTVPGMGCRIHSFSLRSDSGCCRSFLLRREDAVLLNAAAVFCKFPFTSYYNRFFEMSKINTKKQQIFFKTYCFLVSVEPTAGIKFYKKEGSTLSCRPRFYFFER